MSRDDKSDLTFPQLFDLLVDYVETNAEDSMATLTIIHLEERLALLFFVTVPPRHIHIL